MTEKILESIDFCDVDFSDPNIVNRRPNRFRRCPVAVTISDSQVTSVDILQLLESGMNIVKLKMSSSTKGDRIRLLKKIAKAEGDCCTKYGVESWPIATCVELKTFIVKTGILENEEILITLEENSYVILTNDISEYDRCNKAKIFLDNPFLATDIKVGTEISIASDEIVMICTSIIDSKSIKCVVIRGGNLTNTCNVCARDIKHSRPFITKKDLEILMFALEYQIDILVINYLQDADSVRKIKKYIDTKAKRPIILSGIATMEGLLKIDDILKESDGIILSREFLPYELSAANRYRLPNIQKWMAAKCFQVGKPFFISGGIFDEALRSGVIKDCEISDITNAILDGASGFILKDCVSTELVLDVLDELNQLSYYVDPFTVSKSCFVRIVDELKLPINAAEAAIISCATAANQTTSRMIVIPTVTGKTVRALHLMRPTCLIVAVATDVRIAQLLHLYRGVMPLMYNGPLHKSWKDTVEAHLMYAVEYAVKRSWIEYGNLYVSLQRGAETSSFCDMVRINKVAIAKKALVECADENDEEQHNF